MKFCTAILAVAASVATSGVEAFSPSGKGFSQTPSGLMIPQQLQNKDGSLWTPNMVAGGAERAVGQEYYEGAWSILRRRSNVALGMYRMECLVTTALSLEDDGWNFVASAVD
jgi:hypothetical protein